MTVSHFLTRGELSRKRAEKLWNKQCKPPRAELRWGDHVKQQQWAAFLGKIGEEECYWCLCHCPFIVKPETNLRNEIQLWALDLYDRNTADAARAVSPRHSSVRARTEPRSPRPRRFAASPRIAVAGKSEAVFAVCSWEACGRGQRGWRRLWRSIVGRRLLDRRGWDGWRWRWVDSYILSAAYTCSYLLVLFSVLYSSVLITLLYHGVLCNVTGVLSTSSFEELSSLNAVHVRNNHDHDLFSSRKLLARLMNSTFLLFTTYLLDEHADRADENDDWCN